MNSNLITEKTFYSSTYGLIVKIDYYDRKEKILVEKKTFIKEIYPGYIYQLYAQYYALTDNEEEVGKIFLHSMLEQKTYSIPLPEENLKLKESFETVLDNMRHFDIQKFYPLNIEKCKKCIYNNLCDRSLND